MHLSSFKIYLVIYFLYALPFLLFMQQESPNFACLFIMIFSCCWNIIAEAHILYIFVLSVILYWMFSGFFLVAPDNIVLCEAAV